MYVCLYTQTYIYIYMHLSMALHSVRVGAGVLANASCYEFNLKFNCILFGIFNLVLIQIGVCCWRVRTIAFSLVDFVLVVVVVFGFVVFLLICFIVSSVGVNGCQPRCNAAVIAGLFEMFSVQSRVRIRNFRFGFRNANLQLAASAIRALAASNFQVSCRFVRS